MHGFLAPAFLSSIFPRALKYTSRAPKNPYNFKQHFIQWSLVYEWIKVLRIFLKRVEKLRGSCVKNLARFWPPYPLERESDPSLLPHFCLVEILSTQTGSKRRQPCVVMRSLANNPKEGDQRKNPQKPGHFSSLSNWKIAQNRSKNADLDLFHKAAKDPWVMKFWSYWPKNHCMPS